MPSTSTTRLERLAGDGKNRGGGLPLPPLFHTIAAELLDRGESTVEDLIRPVERIITKPERVAELYPGNGYTGLVTDGLEQLAARKLVENTEGRWTLTERFHSRIGKPVTVLSRRKPVPTSIKIVVYRKAERERLSDAATQTRELQAMYNDMRNERRFEVEIIGPQGGRTKRMLRLHPLSRAIPQMSEQEFLDLGQDIKEHGVQIPIVLFNGQVLDGRHRLAAAAALRMPLRVEELTGDETAARDRVVSLNLQRRSLSIPQRGLIVKTLYLPDAEVEAKARMDAGVEADDTLPPRGGRVARSRTVVQIAAERSNGLASARTLERMEPVWDAPKTQERIRSGEITTATAARREALKETGRDAPPDVPGVVLKSVNTNLGQALGSIRRANETLAEEDSGKVAPEHIAERLGEIRAALDETERLLVEQNEQEPTASEETTV